MAITMAIFQSKTPAATKAADGEEMQQEEHEHAVPPKPWSEGSQSSNGFPNTRYAMDYLMSLLVS